MRCTVLRLRFELLRVFGGYESMVKLAEDMGVPLTTLRSWWKDQGAGVNVIPEHQEATVLAFVAKVVPGQISTDRARQILTSPLVHFHNALIPPGGQSWARLFDERLSPKALKLTLSSARLEVAEAETDGPVDADFTVELDAPFEFMLNVPWSGEGILLCEQRGRWLVIPLVDRLLSVTFEAGRWVLPGVDAGGVRRRLRERETPGWCRYFALGVQGVFDEVLRAHFAGPMPLDRYTLDAVADVLLQTPPNKMVLAGASVEVVRSNE